MFQGRVTKVGLLVTPLSVTRRSPYYLVTSIKNEEQAMRVLCCLDGTNFGQVSKATEILSANEPVTLGVLYVTDTGPRKDIEHTRTLFCGTWSSAFARTRNAAGRACGCGRHPE
jgi:hypothetical protein